MNSISFGGTFKIRGNAQNYIREYELSNFCEKNDLDYVSQIEDMNPARSYFDIPSYDIYTTIIAPDNKDALVETYLANQGINFKKLETKDLLNKSKIESRIKAAPKNMKLVKIDAEKLNKILRNQSNNIEYCENDYNNYYKESVDLLIKSGDRIPATTLYINPTGESVADSLDYIKKFGADRINEDQFMLMFNQSTDDPDHCMYFAMKDLGMDKIPVYVNNDTYKIGSALGLLK